MIITIKYILNCIKNLKEEKMEAILWQIKKENSLKEDINENSSRRPKGTSSSNRSGI